MSRLAFVLVAAMCLLGASAAAYAAPLRIVAIGASNTHGWYVGNAGAYPAQLQALLRAKNVDAVVTNAGVPFDTTALMLRRIDRDVPNGTDIAILQPGGNDRRFLVTREQRAANIAQMQRRLRARGIEVIVYDEEIPVRYYTLDFIHLTREGHAMIAAWLLPRIMAVLERREHAPGKLSGR
ncbi:MAG TPA: GDSL-type esterase/lipase family protein [Xanthobacteraceae bacterium]